MLLRTKHRKICAHRRRLDEEQHEILETHFKTEKYLDSSTKQRICRLTGLHAYQVRIWYQNARVRQARQSISMDKMAPNLMVANDLAAEENNGHTAPICRRRKGNRIAEKTKNLSGDLKSGNLVVKNALKLCNDILQGRSRMNASST